MTRPVLLSRRRFLAAAAGAVAAPALGRADRFQRENAPPRPRPTPDQLTWQLDERALFLHFGINTFTDREWGDGTEDPARFSPEALDARTWARTARAAGFRAMILTAKHHDGFCLWPSRTTAHSVASSPWRGGRGDLVREFTDACRAEGLRPGLYLSPWDRNAAVYGDSPRYNDFYADQLTELLTRYGPIHEVWFDGANGEGPNGKKQQYDWPRVWALVRRLQPHAVMFSDAGPDVRWIGNEQGQAGDPNWSTVVPEVVPAPGTSGRAATQMLLHGDPAGTVWRPGETDVSIRPGWFHHPAEDARVREVPNLVDLFFSSVGRNSKLLLNVPPTRAGLLHEVDASRLRGLQSALSSAFAEDLASGRPPRWTHTGPASAIAELDLGRAVPIGVIDLREDIGHDAARGGQRVRAYRVEASPDARGDHWQPVCSGTTIGCRKLDRVTAAAVRRLRISLDCVDMPQPVRVSVFGAPERR